SSSPGTTACAVRGRKPRSWSTPGSTRCHTDGAVETDRLTVDVAVLEDVRGQLTELVGSAQARRVGHGRLERLADVLAQAGEQRGVHDAGGNGVDADALAGEVACGDDRHSDDAGLGRRVVDLADLALEGRDGGRHDHGATLVLDEIEFGHAL